MQESTGDDRNTTIKQKLDVCIILKINKIIVLNPLYYFD